MTLSRFALTTLFSVLPLSAAIRYVEAPGDFTITTDNGDPGLTDDDIVSWPDSRGGIVENLIFGTDAFSNITDAVAEALDGDDIFLGREEFNISGTIVIDKSLNFEGRGTGRTQIDGGDLFRIFDITADPINVSFFNLTIQDGRTPNPDPGDPNSLNEAGAAVRAQNTGTLSFERCTIHRNRGGNGSIAIRNAGAAGEVSFNDCIIQNNFARGFGAGVAMVAPDNSRPVDLRLLRLFLHTNATEGSALYLTGASSISLTRSDIANNSQSGVVPDATLWFSSPDIRVAYCSVRNNKATQSAAFRLESPSTGGTAVISNSTISGNENTVGPFGTITNASPTNLTTTLSNVTLAGNTTTSGDSVFTGALTVGNTISVNNSGGTTSNDTNATDVTDAGGNVLGVPTGLMASDVIDLTLTQINNAFVHPLVAGSPAVNNGINSLISADLTDFNNNGDTTEIIPSDQRRNRIRIRNGTVDSGAYEGLFQAYVARTFIPANPNTGDLVTWKDGTPDAFDNLIFGQEAFTSVNSALNLTDSGATFFIATGTYQESTLALSQSYNLIGDRTGPTILDGLSNKRIIDVEGGVDPIQLRLENLTLTNGAANAENGGALRLHNSNNISATLINCSIGESTAALGGAISIEDGAQLSLIQSTFHDNSSTTSGGAISVDLNSSATLLHATLSGNESPNGGGIIVDTGGTVDLKNSLIVGNTSTSANDDLEGAFTSDGSNFIGDPGTATGLGSDATLNSTSTTLPEVISPIAESNRGLGRTFSLPPGSPALDTGLNANIPTDSGDFDNDGDFSENIPFDQRGAGFPRVFNTTVDIGAYESSNIQPTLALVGDNPLIIECGVASFADPGATAMDDEDDDATLTAAIVVNSSSLNLSTPGNYTVSYDVTDSGGLSATTITRTVTVTDTTPPVITLTGESSISIQQGDPYTDEGATVSDTCDATVTITFGGSVDSNIPATYTLTYDATDVSNNSAIQVTRTVIVTPAPAYSIDTDGTARTEGMNLPFTVTRTGSIDRSGSVDWALTLAGNVTASDFMTTSGTLNFAANENEVELIITTINDDIVELDELVTVTLSNPLPAPATIAGGEAGYTLVNDDTATNSADTNDFTAFNEAINFTGTVGETQQLTVTAIGDLEVELPEIFLLRSGSITASNYDITANDSQGTILNDDTSNLTIADATSLNEGNTGMSSASFNVTLELATPTGFSVDWTLPDSDDVEGASGTLTFLGEAGETQPIAINILGDELVELDETVSVTLSNLSITDGVTLSDAVGDLTILNDDAANVAVLDASADEGEMISFTVNLSQAVDAPLVYDLATDPAVSEDFTLPADTQVTFEPGGALTQTVTFATTEDELVEIDETFTLTLTTAEDNGRAVTLSDATATGTIFNDDASNLTIADATPTNEGNSGTTAAAFSVTLELATPAGFSVDWALPNSDDVEGASGTLNFLGEAGEIQTININVLGDELVELDETVTVTLSNLSATDGVTLNDAQGNLTILNDDTATVAILDASADEGDDLSFTVNLSQNVDAPLIYNVASIPATSTDFTPPNNLQVTFEPDGPLTQTFTIATTEDEIVEADEIYTFTLSTAENNGRAVTLSDSLASATIVNDAPSILSIADVSIIEGSPGTTTATFNVTSSLAVDVPFSVSFATANGNTTSDDFTSTNGTLNFAGTAGEQESFTVSIIGDTALEADETFQIVLTDLNPTDRSITLPAPATGTIINDDTTDISITNTSVAEGDTETTEATFSVNLVSAVPGGSFQVDYNVPASGSVAATSGTLTFAGTAGEIQTFTAQVTPDNLVEEDETFTAAISNITGTDDVLIFVASAVGTITDDDFAPMANPDNYQLTGSNALTIAASTGFLANDTDEDDGQAALTRLTIPAPPQVGTLLTQADGSFTYTPGANFTGSDSFVYEVTDGTNTSTGTVNITANLVPESQFGIPQIQDDGSVIIAIRAVPGLEYEVLFSPNLENFQPLQTIVPTTNVLNFIDTRKPLANGLPNGFYIFRVRALGN